MSGRFSRGQGLVELLLCGDVVLVGHGEGGGRVKRCWGPL